MATTATKKKATPKKAKASSDTVKTKDLSASYNKPKEFNGQQYTGMQIGRSHKWNYDAGVWRETKITPERWELTYDVVKRRAGHAPEGSGVPVGTAYHWFILSHQYVEKLDANDYSTSMVGLKFKLAHKRADKAKWSASDATQRKHLVKILKDLINELEQEPEKTVPVPINFDYKDEHYEGVGIPVMSSCDDGVCQQLDITLNKKHLGVIKCTKNGWRINGVKQGLTNAIGDQIFHWYE
ncbi:MAG: hypothetical protein ACTHJ0_16785 [Flavipsychrobacter sp.]